MAGRHGSFVAQRADEHARRSASAGRRWPSRAAAGRRRRSRAPGRRRGAGISTATPSPAQLVQGRVDRVVVARSAVARAGSAGSRSSCELLDGGAVLGQVQLDRRPPASVGQRPGWPGRARARRPGRSTRSKPAPTASAAAARSSRPTPVQDAVDRRRGRAGCPPGRPASPGRGRWGRPGARRCMPQVGGVPVVAVGDQGLAGGQPRVDRGEQLAGRGSPRPGAAGRCGRRSRRSGCGPAPGAATAPDRGRAPRCTSRIGAGLSASSAIRSASSSACTRVDALVREDGAVVGVAGAVRDVQRADQAAHGEAGGGVLVQVERGLVVAAELSAFAATVVSRAATARYGRAKSASGGRVADPPRAEPDPVEGRQPQRSAHVRRGDHGAGVHRRIVGANRGDGLRRRPGSGVAGELADRLTAATTWRCSTSTGSSTSAATRSPARRSTWPRPGRPGCGSRSSPTTRRGPPATVAEHLRELGVGRRPGRRRDVGAGGRPAARGAARRRGPGGRARRRRAGGGGVARPDLEPVEVEDDAEAW